MKPFLTSAIVFTLMFSCAERKSGDGSDADAFEPDKAEKDVYYLSDAVVLEQISEYSPGDAGEYPLPETGEEQIEESAGEYDDQSVFDEPAGGETVVVNQCKEFFGACPDKFSCADQGGSFSCVFVAECSKTGLVTIDDLVKSPVKYSGAYLKIGWNIAADSPICTKIACGNDNPCCNTCYSKLFLNISNFKIYLLGNGMNIGCQGNECDFTQKCAPALSENMYLLWGKFIYNQGIAELILDGFCQPPF